MLYLCSHMKILTQQERVIYNSWMTFETQSWKSLRQHGWIHFRHGSMNIFSQVGSIQTCSYMLVFYHLKTEDSNSPLIKICLKRETRYMEDGKHKFDINRI